jgi:enoyl-CoA hydratase/carnithine racemase
MDRSQTTVHVGVVDGIAHLRLDRQSSGNALDTALLVSLIDVLDRSDQPTVPLLLTGGADLFSVGCDLPELSQFDAYAATAYAHLGHQAVAALERWPGVTVAVVDGPCLGAGLELALGCDIIIATPQASFGLPGLALALLPCLGGLRRLGCRLPPGLGTRMFLGGQLLDGRQAWAAGLADRLADDHHLAAAAVLDHRDWTVSAVRAIRSLRLDRQGPIDPGPEADLFARAFADGECQRRLRAAQ